VGQAVEEGWNIPFPLTHEEIGFLVGAHRVSISRAIGKLRETGQIRAEGKYFFIKAKQQPH
jgi:CRP/FNR family transcriptional regulator